MVHGVKCRTLIQKSKQSDIYQEVLKLPSCFQAWNWHYQSMGGGGRVWGGGSLWQKACLANYMMRNEVDEAML